MTALARFLIMRDESTFHVNTVIPAKAGIQRLPVHHKSTFETLHVLDSRLRGNDGTWIVIYSYSFHQQC
jgi:hypothetical protein